MSKVDDRINDAARQVAARAVEPVPPFKVPLAESIGKGALSNMSTTKVMAIHRRPKVYGVPILIEQILRSAPDGLRREEITDRLRQKIDPAAEWDSQRTSNALTNMSVKHQITRWPGNVWKLGPKPFVYESGAGVPKEALNGGAGKIFGKPDVQHRKIKVKDAKPAKVAKTKLVPLPGDDVLARAARLIDECRDMLGKLGDVVADLETAQFHQDQRQKAIEAARQLLTQAGV